MEYYTIYDIQIITGYSKKEACKLIEKLNDELKDKFKIIRLKPSIYKNKISRYYFIKRMEREI